MAESTTKKGAGDIDPAKLKKLMADYEKMKHDMDSERGDIGSMLKTAEDSLGLHRGAFKLAHKLKNMPTDRRNDFIRALDSYIEILSLDEQPDMLDESANANAAAA